jgi:hypothetical protein
MNWAMPPKSCDFVREPINVTFPIGVEARFAPAAAPKDLEKEIEKLL